jgi:CRISPR-associated protein Cas1
MTSVAEYGASHLPSVAGLRTLYLENPGSILGVKSGERFVVRFREETLLEVSAHEIGLIVVLGKCELTTLAMQLCLTRGTPVVLLSGQGRDLGALQAIDGRGLVALRDQFRFAENHKFSLQIAKDLVERKISARLSLLQLYMRRKAGRIRAGELEAIDRIRQQVKAAQALDEVRGMEGRAGNLYFQLFGRLIDPDLGFERRVRRSPTDPVNCLLNLGYTLLFYNSFAQVVAAGLSPYVGFFHSPGLKQPALAGDLIEPILAPAIESLALFLIDTAVFCTDDFRTGATGRHSCTFKSASLSTYFTHFDRWTTRDFTEARELDASDMRHVIAANIFRLRQQILEYAGRI